MNLTPLLKQLYKYLFRNDKTTVYGQVLKRLHDPDAAGTGIPAETAGNTFIRVGDVFITNSGGHLPAGDGTGRAHGLAEMAIPALAAGKAAIRLALNIDTTLDIREIMGRGQGFKIDKFLVKGHPLFSLDL